MSKKAQSLSINTIIIAAICADFTTTIDDTEYTASWQTAACSAEQKEISTAADATAHIGEHCCIAK